MARPKGVKNKPKAAKAPPVITSDEDPFASVPAAAPEVDFNEADFRRDIEEVARQKSNAQEYAGNAGQAVKQCAERSGLNRKVIGLCASMKVMEPAKRTALVSDLIKGLNAMGYLDEGTLFDTPRKQAQAAAGGGADDERDLRPRFLQEGAGDPPLPPEEDIVATNVHRLRGIKPLEDGDASGTYQVN